MRKGLSFQVVFLLILFVLQIKVNADTGSFFRMPSGISAEESLPGKIIFKLKPEAAPYGRTHGIDLESISQVLDQYRGETPRKTFPHHQPPEKFFHPSGQPLVDLSLIYEVTIAAEENLEEAINALYATGHVEYAQPRYLPSLLYVPDDPFVGAQYYLENIQAFDAWGITKGDTNMVVAIVDTGTELNHPDLVGAVKYNYDDPINGEDSDNDGFVDNFHGWDLGEGNNIPQYNANAHGVHVSGIAAATADNNTGIAGVGFDTKYLPVKIDDEFGRLVMAYEGIVYAADQGAQIINCSWGGSIGAGQFGQDIVNYAVLNRDALVVASAGNSNNQVPFYPASYQNVLSVAATNIDDEKWENSSFGIHVDVSAPGANIISTWPNSQYISSSGTSMSAPVVSGAAALVRDQFPEYSALQIGAQLKVTADNIDTLEANLPYAGLLGTGRINIYRALTETHMPYIQLVDHVFSDEEYGQFQPGGVLPMAAYFQNLLAPAGNITAHLTSESPYLNILDSVVTLGPMDTYETIDNTHHPFQVELLEGLPASKEVVFMIEFQDEQGEYAGRQIFSLTLNVDFLNVYANRLSTTITSKGTVGHNYPNYNQGVGLIYDEGLSLIKCAGIIMGASTSQVVDNIYGAVEGSFNQFLHSLENAHILEGSTQADVHVSGRFNDANAGVFALDLEVEYHVYFMEESPNDKFFVLEYHIVNTSQEAFQSFYTGFFADWIIRDNKQHRATFDAVNRMGYAYSAAGGSYTAVQLLTEGGMRHYAFDNKGFGGSINISNGFTGFEKYTALKSNRINAGVFDKDNDISTLLSTGPFNLAPNDTLTVAFALLAGDHLSDLESSALAVYNWYHGVDDPTAVVTPENPAGKPMKVFPNPFGDHLQLHIYPENLANHFIQLFDMRGNLVKSLDRDFQDPEKQTILIPAGDLPTGAYLLKVSDGQNTYTEMVLKR